MATVPDLISPAQVKALIQASPSKAYDALATAISGDVNARHRAVIAALPPPAPAPDPTMLRIAVALETLAAGIPAPAPVESVAGQVAELTGGLALLAALGVQPAG